MAASGESSYLPPLDQCLNREKQLLSWKEAYAILSKPPIAVTHSPLRQFLEDDTTRTVLRAWLKPFEPETDAVRQHAKTLFETKTSAASFSHADAKDIKENAQWLSEEVGLDGLSAVRIAVLEYLDRPAAHLGQGFTEEERNSLRDAAAGIDLGASTTSFDASVEPLPSSFDARSSKNARLMRTYLSERLHVVRIGDLLRRLELDHTFMLGAETAPTWLADVSKAIARRAQWKDQQWQTLCDSTVTAAALRVQQLRPEIEDPEIAETWVWTHLSELNAMFQSFLSSVEAIDTIPDSQAVLAWFKFAAGNEFFKNVVPVVASHQSAVALLQSLTALISVSILRISIIDDIEAVVQNEPGNARRQALEASYAHDASCLGDLQRIFLEACTWGPSPAAPALFAWAMLILTFRDVAAASSTERQDSIASIDDDDASSHRQSLSAPPETAFERAAEVIRSSLSEDDVFQYVAASAADACNAHEVVATLSGILQSSLSGGVDDAFQIQARMILLRFLEKSSSLTGYSSGLVAASITVAEGTRRSWTRPEKDAVLSSGFARPGSFLTGLSREAEMRYPLELLPFLNFRKMQLHVSPLGGDGLIEVVEGLKGLKSFTQVMSDSFYGYDQPSPDLDYNLIQLNEVLKIFRPRRNAIAYGTSVALMRPGDAAEIDIPSGTEGRIIADSKPHVVSWRHQHSALQYLTNALATVVAGCDWVETSKGVELSLTDASEIVSFFATSIEVTMSSLRQKGASPADAGNTTLAFVEGLKDGFQSDRDLVNIVLDILEQQLQNHCHSPGLEGSIETLVNCMHFATATIKLCPGRIWSFLARSSLLELDGGGGSLVAVVEATEMVSGRYDFLVACLRLYEALLQDAVCDSVARKATKTSSRFGSPDPFRSTPDRTICAVLLAFTKTASGLFARSLEWRFASFEDKAEAQTSVVGLFDKILTYSYAYDDASDHSSKLTAVLHDSAQYLIDLFITPSSATVVSQPLGQMLFEAVSAPYDRIPELQKRLWHNQTQTVLQFLTTLSRTSNLQNFAVPALQATFPRITPLLARLFAASVPCRRHVISLLEAIVRISSESAKEPPSLLGHMGPESAKSFLAVLTDMTINSASEEAQIAVWNLFSAVVSCRQQWFAIFILSGETAKESLKSRRAGLTSNNEKSIFKYALDRLSNLSELKPAVAIAVLKFVNLAQSFWPRVIREIRSHSRFLDGILAYLGTLKRNEREKDADRLTRSCQETRIASLIAEILAMCVHFARQLGDLQVAEKVAPKLSYFKEFGAAAPKYNNSLHANLKKNLEAKYPGCKLENFKRTALRHPEFGTDFFYDLEFASNVLDFDPQWSKPRSLRTEFPLANVDLSLVEAQIELLHSWKLLAIELSNVSDQVQRLQELLSTVIYKCLEANISTENPPTVYERLVQVRADFAFVLLQRLLRTSMPLQQLEPLFQKVWDAVRCSGVDFEVAFASPSADYYRSLLKLLYLALTPHLEGRQSSNQSKIKLARPKISPALLEVLERVVALGFKTLATQLHENPATTEPADFVLITALLQSILRVQGASILHSQVVSLFAAANATRYATSLFSWADQLALAADPDNPDPVYGELSIRFLLELSTVPLMAENMAVEGVFASLSTARLCQYYQRDSGTGPFDKPHRLFTIWSKGILPFTLNVLDSVGAPIAAEVASFLNQFAPQMARNTRDLESRTIIAKSTRARAAAEMFAGAITLNLASETHNLALLSFALQHGRELGSAAGINSEDIELLEWDKEGVKEDVQVWLNGSRALAGKIVAVSVSEERLLRTAPKDKNHDNALEEKILGELRGAFLCLGGASNETDGA